MANEVNQRENSLDLPSGDQNPPELGGVGQSVVSEAGVAELEGLATEKDEELAKTSARLIELEQAMAGRDSEIATLKQAQAEQEGRLSTLSQAMAEAVASYKAMVVQANPEVLEELISGDTVESINESLSQAKTLISKVRQGLEAEISLTRFPAGAPERTLPDLSGLSPREKIQYAIRGTP